MKAQRLVRNHALVKSEAAFLQSFPASRVAGVQHRHIILLRHGVYRCEQGTEILLRVDILLPVGGEQDIFSLFKAKPGMNIACLDLEKIPAQHLRHWTANNECAILRDARGVQIAPRVLGVAEVYVGGYIHNAAVGFLRQAFVEAAVPGLHMEDRNVKPLGSNDGQAGICVTQHQHGVRLDLLHEIVAFGDNRADRLAEVCTGGIQVIVRRAKPQIFKEHLIQLVVVILPRVDENLLEIAVAALDGSRKTDDLRSRAEDRHQLEFFHFRPPHRTCPGAAGRSTRWPTSM